jgi:opacity protein-like surface antigen
MIAANRGRAVARRAMKGRHMRWVIVALFVLNLAPRAFAADLDILRGSEPVGPAFFTNWSGFYAGGTFSYGNTSADFSSATQPLIHNSLLELQLENIVAPSQWPVLSSASVNAAGFGGFVGYNMQFQDLIIGVEGNYTHASATVRASNSPIIDRIVTAGSLQYTVNVTGSATLSPQDVGTLRMRAGYIVNNWLPYGFVGVALGRADYQITSCVYGQQDPTNVGAPTGCGQAQSFVGCATVAHPSCVNYSVPNSTTGKDVLIYGLSAGGGVDYAFTHNIFARGEFEYIQFAPIAHITASEINGRVGLGVKF